MPPKSKSTRVDSAYERLKSDILTGALPPGFQAPEPDIADRLGMSRTPVREALIRLEAEKLVDLIPRRGARVVPISPGDLCEIFDILAVLEELAARSAAKKGVPPELQEEIGRINLQSEQALASRNMDCWAELDDNFHRRIAECGGNARLETQISGFLDQVFRANSMLLRLNKAPASNAPDHKALFEAILSSDIERAGKLARDHRANALKTMKVLLQESGLSRI